MTDQPTPAPLPYADVRARAREAATHREHADASARAYLERIRSEVARLGAPAVRSDDIRAAIAVLEEQAHIDPLAPLDSTRKGVVFAKQLVRKAVFFTTYHLAAQLSSLGWSTVWLGHATADRIEQLERRLDAIEAGLLREVEDLRARVEQSGARPGNEGGPPAL